MTSDQVIRTHREWLEAEVNRLQAQLNIAQEAQQLDYYAYPGGDRYNHTLFFLDRNRSDNLRQMTDYRLDFRLQYILQVKKDLMTFSNSYQQFVSVALYSNPTDSLLLSKSELAPLDKNVYWFAVTNYSDKALYLSGGRNDKGLTSKEVYVFNVDEGVWGDKREPDLNVGRIDHGVCVLGDRIYVVCGYAYGYGYLESMEMLDLSVERKRSILGRESGRTWNIFTVPPLTPR